MNSLFGNNNEIKQWKSAIFQPDTIQKSIDFSDGNVWCIEDQIEISIKGKKVREAAVESIGKLSGVINSILSDMKDIVEKLGETPNEIGYYYRRSDLETRGIPVPFKYNICVKDSSGYSNDETLDVKYKYNDLADTYVYKCNLAIKLSLISVAVDDKTSYKIPLRSAADIGITPEDLKEDED